jgi:hypothetical protein
MSNADCEKAEEAQAKEKLSKAIQTVIEGLIARGYSADNIRDYLQTSLNKADDDGEWEITVTRFN